MTFNREESEYEEIEYENELLNSILDTLQGIIYCNDIKGKIIYANNKFFELYDETKSDKLITKDKMRKYYEKISNVFINEDNYVIESKKTISIEKRIILWGRKEFDAEIIKTPIVDESNNVIYITTFILDRSKKKKEEEKLKHLSYTDVLTGLYNRAYFEEQSEKLFLEENLPIGVIMGDANALKLVNDTFGHEKGDELLKIVANIFNEVCGEKHLIFRIGGDEFVILLTNTCYSHCEKVIDEIYLSCKNYKHNFIEISISLGAAITDNLDKTINDTLKEAEKKVYNEKIIGKSNFNSSIICDLNVELEKKKIETENHIERVLKNSVEIGKRLDLSALEMNDLKMVAKLHDIGKIGISEEILLKIGRLTKEEFEIIKTHTEKGYRIVKASNKLDTVAKAVLTHHERWDGMGYPLNLKGEDIPLIARIINVADSYDVMTNDSIFKKALTKEEGINELLNCSGSQFDPQIVKIFVDYLQHI